MSKSDRSASDIVLTIVPLGIPGVSYPQAFGIMLMLVVFVKHLGDGDDNSFSGHKVTARLIVMGLMHLVFFLLGGQL